jgi:hypothetical protein
MDFKPHCAYELCARTNVAPLSQYLNAKKTRDLMHNLRANGTGLTTRDKPADANV